MTAIDEVGRLQAVLRAVPASSRRTSSTIRWRRRRRRPSGWRSLRARGECQIGAHLHPWVTPPYAEPLGRRTATRATSAPISSATRSRGCKRRDRRAPRRDAARVQGRPLRVRPDDRGRRSRRSASTWTSASIRTWTYRSDGGPSFEGFDAGAGVVRRARAGCSKLPCTTGFVGRGAARRARRCTARRRRRWLQPLRAVGILARSGHAEQGHAVARRQHARRDEGADRDAVRATACARSR